MPGALDGSPLNSAAAIGVEMEKLRDTVYPQFNQDDTFMSRVPVRNDLKVSARLVRIPILAQPGATFGQFTPDGTTNSMGTGGGSIYDEGVATPAYFCQSCQVTKEAEWATNSSEKAIVDVFKEEFKTNLRQFRTNLEALMAGSDGSGTLGNITTVTTTTQLLVSNSNAFQAGCTYQVWSALGGTNRGNITVQTVDLINNILYLSAAVPSGTIAGDLLLVAGAPGTSSLTYTPDRYTTASIAASLNGVPAINLATNTGNWFGIPRTTYPGVLNPAYINGASGALTPQQIILLESLIQRANGADAEELDEYVVQANVDQSGDAAFEIVCLRRLLHIDARQKFGGDVLKRNKPAGRSEDFAPVKQRRDVGQATNQNLVGFCRVAADLDAGDVLQGIDDVVVRQFADIFSHDRIDHLAGILLDILGGPQAGPHPRDDNRFYRLLVRRRLIRRLTIRRTRHDHQGQRGRRTCKCLLPIHGFPPYAASFTSVESLVDGVVYYSDK